MWKNISFCKFQQLSILIFLINLDYKSLPKQVSYVQISRFKLDLQTVRWFLCTVACNLLEISVFRSTYTKLSLNYSIQGLEVWKVKSHSFTVPALSMIRHTACLWQFMPCHFKCYHLKYLPTRICYLFAVYKEFIYFQELMYLHIGHWLHNVLSSKFGTQVLCSLYWPFPAQL